MQLTEVSIYSILVCHCSLGADSFVDISHGDGGQVISIVSMIGKTTDGLLRYSPEQDGRRAFDSGSKLHDRKDAHTVAK